MAITTTDAESVPTGIAAPPTRRAWWRRSWVALFAVYCLGFGMYGGTRTFNPALQEATPRAGLSWHYALLVCHVTFGIVAVSLAWVQVWPWLRDNHPRIHRRLGWIYFFGGVIPGGLLAFPAAILTTFGQGLRYGFLAMATLWAITTVCGLRAGIQHRFEDHRRWMYRNVAMTTSTITVRFLQPLAIGITQWLLPNTYAGQTHLVIVEGATAGLWAAFVGHLLFVEWVVLRPRRRRRAPVVRAAAH